MGAQPRPGLGCDGPTPWHQARFGRVPSTYDRWARPITLDDDLHRAFPDRGKGKAGKVAGGGKVKADAHVDHGGGKAKSDHGGGKAKSDHGAGKSSQGKSSQGKSSQGKDKGGNGKGKG